jgi:DNA-binding response OmpR family regulator
MLDIVLYENNDLMRELLSEWLSQAGYRVRTAMPDGERADLVIVSLSTPKDTGLMQVREIRAAHPGAPVIALSAQFRSGLSTNGATAETLGVRQVIAKPLARTDLLKAVRAIIGSPA